MSTDENTPSAGLGATESAERPERTQVGWLGPYGIVPGGMDNDPAPGWLPIFVEGKASDVD